MNEDSTLFMDWVQSMTVTDFVNIILLIFFTWGMVVLVARTFRGKSDI